WLRRRASAWAARPVLGTYPAATEIYTLSLHDALPICVQLNLQIGVGDGLCPRRRPPPDVSGGKKLFPGIELVGFETQLSGDRLRSEEHTSELQSLAYLVCRLLLEKKQTHLSTDNQTTV